MSIISIWLKNVAFSHSNSKRTELSYRKCLRKFLNYTNKTAEDILTDYKNSTDREFKREYANYVRAFIADIADDYAVGTIRTFVSVIRSFFKYNDLPLGHVPIAKNHVTYHNRDITKEEISNIISQAGPREQAFFCMMVKSGLRPYTICQLRFKYIQPDYSKRTIPCKINVPSDIAKGKYHSYFSFMDEEAVNYLETYLKPQKRLPNDFLFTSKYSNTKPANPASFSVLFARHLLNLKHLINFEDKGRGKPREIRLYCLRKWFRKQAGQAGIDYVHFWMGHKLEHQDMHYFSREVELHRKQYKEKAMPFLRLESNSLIKAEITEQTRVITNLRQQVKDLQRRLEIRQRATEYSLREMREKIDSLEAEVHPIHEAEEQVRTEQKRAELLKKWREEERKKK